MFVDSLAWTGWGVGSICIVAVALALLWPASERYSESVVAALMALL